MFERNPDAFRLPHAPEARGRRGPGRLVADPSGPRVRGDSDTLCPIDEAERASGGSSMIIDAHQLLWDRPRQHPRLYPGSPMTGKSYSFRQLQPTLRAIGVNATVMVQSLDLVEENARMLSIADDHPEVVAVVAYAPLGDPADVARTLDDLAGDDRIVGFRSLVESERDPDYLLRPAVSESLALLAAAGKTLDVIATSETHLENVMTVGERHPRLRIVLDHLACPPVGEGEREPWWSLIEEAAQNPLVHAKVSGLYPRGEMINDWGIESIRPFIDHAIEAFGPNRLMYGGVWPIATVAGGYEHVFTQLSQSLSGLSPDDASLVWADTAARFYGIAHARLARACKALSEADLIGAWDGPGLGGLGEGWLE